MNELSTQQFKQASSFEASRVLSAEKSQARAWYCAGALGICLVCALIAIALMMPLKKTTPYVMTSDPVTGAPIIVSLLDTKIETGNEVRDKYWLSKFVRHFESYDYHNLQLDYDTVGVLASPAVGKAYSEQFEGDNALHESYRDKITATVEIISIVPSGKGSGTVRFRKTTTRDTGRIEDVSTYVATVAYDYKNTASDEQTRQVNPWGFTVESYRVDPEMVGAGS